MKDKQYDWAYPVVLSGPTYCIRSVI